MTVVALLAVGSGLTFIAYGLRCLSFEWMGAEFTRFGLARLRVLTGALEVLGGVGQLAGLLWPPALWLSSGGLALLMMFGFGVRVRVKDSVLQTLPALVLMFVNVVILYACWPNRG